MLVSQSLVEMSVQDQEQQQQQLPIADIADATIADATAAVVVNGIVPSTLKTEVVAPAAPPSQEPPRIAADSPEPSIDLAVEDKMELDEDKATVDDAKSELHFASSASNRFAGTCPTLTAAVGSDPSIQLQAFRASAAFNVIPISLHRNDTYLTSSDSLVADTLRRRREFLTDRSRCRDLLLLHGVAFANEELDRIICLQYVDLGRLSPCRNPSYGSSSQHGRAVVSEKDEIQGLSGWLASWRSYQIANALLYPARTDELRAYADHITAISSQYPWHALYDYDKRRRQHAADNLSGSLEEYESELHVAYLRPHRLQKDNNSTNHHDYSKDSGKGESGDLRSHLNHNNNNNNNNNHYRDSSSNGGGPDRRNKSPPPRPAPYNNNNRSSSIVRNSTSSTYRPQSSSQSSSSTSRPNDHRDSYSSNNNNNNNNNKNNNGGNNNGNSNSNGNGNSSSSNNNNGNNNNVDANRDRIDTRNGRPCFSWNSQAGCTKTDCRYLHHCIDCRSMGRCLPSCPSKERRRYPQ
ncbi:hypothetical protein HKX48_007272 [Thoreauomyces humboldtii]|nr:hypothetical protein HKX48_007272 [Thoreauomyces humboldtii]